MPKKEKSKTMPDVWHNLLDDPLFGVRTVARFLASRAEPVDWTDLARLILTREAQTSEAVRRQVARDYYSAQSTREHGSQS